ncbi:MAG: MOSC domain-containing protein [Acidimicrobiia bacterium]
MIDGRRAGVAELWRYPVKSMQGERLEAADVTDGGLSGDRAYAVVDRATGKVGSAKHPRLWGALLECRARYLGTPTEGQLAPPVAITLPGGSETGSEDPQVDEHLSAVFDRPVQLTTVAPEGNSYLAVWPEMDGVMPDDFREQNATGADPDGTLTDLALALAAPPGTFFDVSTLHVLTTATLQRLGEVAPGSQFAVERYRPNIVIDSDAEPFAENGWSGATMRFGAEVTASVLIPTMRCIMTTLAQGELPRDNAVLRTVSSHNRIEIPGLGTWSCVGAYATVGSAGRVVIGDEVSVDGTDAHSPEPEGAAQ